MIKAAKLEKKTYLVNEGAFEFWRYSICTCTVLVVESIEYNKKRLEKIEMTWKSDKKIISNFKSSAFVSHKII